MDKDNIIITAPSRRWFALFGVGMGVLMATIDSSIVNISLPTLEAVFHTNFATVQWVMLSYVVVLTSLMLGAARLGDMFNKKYFYLGGLILFTIGSFLCAISPNIYFLIGFRALQGLGAVFTQALGMAIVTEVFPSSERGRALGIMGSIISVGIAAGPPLGGLIIGLASWHWVFLVNVPLGIFSTLIILRFIPDLKPAHPDQKFDATGALIMFATLSLYALAMTMGQLVGFGSREVQLLLLALPLGVAIFLLVESRIKQPMIDLSLFKNVLFNMNLVMSFLVFVVLGGLFIIPYYLELVQGYSTTMSGLLMMAEPLCMGSIAPLAGALSDRFGSRVISLFGLISISLGAFLLSTYNVGQTPLDFVLRMIPIGFGMGMFQSPNNSAVMGAVPRERLSITSGLLALSRTLGQTTGLPLIGALFTANVLAFGHLPAGTDVTTASPVALVAGIHNTFQIAALVILASTLIAVAAIYLDQRYKSQLKESAHSTAD